MAARLRTLYNDTLVGELKTKFDRKNLMSLPKLQKIVINMGVGTAVNDKKRVDRCQRSDDFDRWSKASANQSSQVDRETSVCVKAKTLVAKLHFAEIACTNSWIA